VDSEQTARHVREVEAESVALICCETLGLEGADFCRGYIKHWLRTEKETPNQSAACIFAADCMEYRLTPERRACHTSSNDPSLDANRYVSENNLFPSAVMTTGRVAPLGSVSDC